MVLGKLDRYKQKNETTLCSYTTHRIISKGIKDLNVRAETTKIIKENIGSKVSDIAHRKFFYQIYIPRQGKQKKK